MRRLPRIFLLVLALSLSLLPYPAPAKDHQEKTTDFIKRYLSVTPPNGWEMEQESQGGFMTGMFEDCTAYVQKDGSLGVMVCPVLGEKQSFADTRKDFMQDSHFSLHDRCLIGKDEELAILLVPLKNDREDKQGAVFIVVNKEPMIDGGSGGKDILQKASPMLRLFTHFDWPKKIFEGKAE